VNVVHQPAEARSNGDRFCVCIGFFDGVHIGHQQIIRQTLADARLYEARPLVITFDKHPNTVVAPERVPPLIYSPPQKLHAIENLGVEDVLLFHFDKALSQRTGGEFIRQLASDLGSLRSVCVGANFVFGHRRSGNVELLERLGGELGFIVHGMAAVALDETPVSSTRIRGAIRSGNLDFASQMLGRTYSISGEVLRGDALGRQLGFPTANIDFTGRVLPPNGVYAIHAIVGQKRHRGVLNIGVRPTLRNPNPELRVEAHLLDFEGDLYGHELEVILRRKLREERQFSGLDELKRQIQLDVENARSAL
jgi:riboflavin kinase/FMN adenylyltransferase